MKKLLLVLMVIAIGCSKDDPAPLAIAEFATSEDGKFAPWKIQFENFSKNHTKVEWDFGDGTTSTENEPSHIYTTGGTYQVRLDAYNSENVKDTKTKSIVILNIPTKFQILSLNVTSIPFADGTGAGWDLTNGPDVYFSIADNNDIEQFTTSLLYQDVVNGNLPLVFDNTFGFPVQFPSSIFDLNYKLLFFDADSPDDDDFMGGYTFKVKDYMPTDGITEYPTSLTFGPSANQITFSASVKWLE